MNADELIITDKIREKFFENLMPPVFTTCVTWIGSTDVKGYGRIGFNENGKKKQYKAHRVSYEIHKGSVPPDMCVCHSCDNTHCVNPDHLWLGTLNDNTQDMIKKGRTKNWDNCAHPNSKLTDEQVLDIIKDNRLHRVIAKAHGVTRETISVIKRGQGWKHLRK